MDLPIAANVIDKLDKPVDPEDTSNDQDGDKRAIFLNPGTTDLGRQKGIWQSDLDRLSRMETVVHHLVGKEDVIVHTANQEGGEGNHKEELHEFKHLSNEHTCEAILLVEIINV